MTKEDLTYGYFSNSLTDDELKLLEDLLATDREFLDEFNFEKNLKKVAGRHETQTLKTRLKDYESNRKEDIQIQPSKFKFYSIAALLLVLLAIGWFAYNTVFNLNYQELYADNYQNYPNTVFEITRSDSDDSIERQAFVAYESGDYHLAIEKFKLIPSRDYSNFYLAQSYTQENKSTNAILLYKEIIAKKQQFGAESHWYLALLYLKNKDKSSAKRYLENLISKYEYNTDKAKVLLKKLN